jgi:hypothetical protein
VDAVRRDAVLQSTVYRAAAGAFIALVVALQYWLLVEAEPAAAVARLSLRFFSFFTILTNVVAAVALLAPLIAPRSAAGAFFARPSVRTAIAGYIVMVGVVYYLLLRGVSQREGWPLFLELLLHYVTPPLFVIDWLAFVPKGGLDWRTGARALLFPLGYIGWTLAHGAASGWYPYPFVDVADLGYVQVLANIAGLVLAFLLLELALVACGRALARRGG